MNGKRFLALLFIALAVDSWATGIMVVFHLWFWFALGVTMAVALSATIIYVWPKPEPPKPLDRTPDLRNRWRGKE